MQGNSSTVKELGVLAELVYDNKYFVPNYSAPVRDDYLGHLEGSRLHRLLPKLVFQLNLKQESASVAV